MKTLVYSSVTTAILAIGSYAFFVAIGLNILWSAMGAMALLAFFAHPIGLVFIVWVMAALTFFRTRVRISIPLVWIYASLTAVSGIMTLLLLELSSTLFSIVNFTLEDFSRGEINLLSAVIIGVFLLLHLGILVIFALIVSRNIQSSIQQTKQAALLPRFGAVLVLAAEYVTVLGGVMYISLRS